MVALRRGRRPVCSWLANAASARGLIYKRVLMRSYELVLDKEGNFRIPYGDLLLSPSAPFVFYRRPHNRGILFAVRAAPRSILLRIFWILLY